MLKRTKAELSSMLAPGGYMPASFRKDNYIYLVDGNGNPIPFYGIHGDINGGTSFMVYVKEV